MKKLTEMTGPELVATYNEIAKELDEALVIRFPSRAAGVKRVEAIQDRKKQHKPNKKEGVVVDRRVEDRRSGERRGNHREEVRANPNQCPNCGAIDDQTYAGVSPEDQEYNLCHHCGTEYDPTTGGIRKRSAHSDKRSAAIAETWKDEEVKAKRAKRHGVRVSKKGKKPQEFRSVRQAFVALNLPLSRHIKFRMELKEAGELKDAFGYDWEAIEL